MKVLYLANESEEATRLNIPAEIAKLKEVFAKQPEDLVVMPGVLAEDLPSTLFRQTFSVLHLTAHGEGDVFQTLSGRGVVKTSADQLTAFFDRSKPVDLVFLNVCDSEQIAERLTADWPERGTPFAIAATNIISAADSVAGGATFYTYLLGGASLADAHIAAKAAVELLSHGRVGFKLCHAKGMDAALTYFSPQIHARLVTKFEPGDRNVEIVFGIKGPLALTTQVIFFTPDGGVIEDEDEALGSQLCQITREARNSRNMMWCDDVESWIMRSDCTVFATGVTAEEDQWSAKPTTLIEALRRWYAAEHHEGGKRPSVQPFTQVLKLLDR